MKKSHFDKKKSVKIIIHGWRSDGTGALNELIMEGMLIIKKVYFNMLTIFVFIYSVFEYL